MTKLTLAEKLIYRDIKRAAVMWLLLLRLDPRPVTEKEAAEILSIDKETARNYLNKLNEHQIITRLSRYGGYILTQSGRQLALPSELEQAASAEIPPSEPIININDSESLKDLKQLILIGEGGNPTFEGGKSTFEENPEIAAALLDLGITENTKTRDLISRGLTTRDIANAKRKVIQDPSHNLNETGLLIVIMENLIKQRETGRKSYAEWNS